MDSAFGRIKLLIDESDFKQIRNSKVMVVGCGGVGAMCVEALARMGVGTLILVDHDVVNITNLNRQVHALHSTIGKKKIKALKNRIMDIQADIQVIDLDMFVNQDNISVFDQYEVDVIVDAIDTVSSKLLLIEYAQTHKIDIVSCMGMGNRLDPTQIQVLPLRKTQGDPLAKVMRYQCRKQGLDDRIMVVASLEIPIKQNQRLNESSILKEAMPPASSSFVPMAAGLACGHQVIKYLLKKE